MAPPRHSAKSAAAYARSIRSTYGTATYGTGPGGGWISFRCLGPVTCSTCTPALVIAPTAPASARFSDTAPCEPPVTSSTGRAGLAPQGAPALSPAPQPAD